jgi:L-alanine-DL-glutamate epimerase-like enolase superfamily enzyme
MDFFHRLFMFVLGGIAGVIGIAALVKGVAAAVDPMSGVGAGIFAVALVCGYAFRKWEESL